MNNAVLPEAGNVVEVRIAMPAGTQKSLSESTDRGLLIQKFADKPNGVSALTTPSGNKETHASHAVLLNDISSFLFEYLDGYRIPTHFVRKCSSQEMLVRKLTMIPLEVEIRNVATGSYARRFDLKEGSDLLFPVIEHYYKRADLGKPLVNDFHIFSLGIATPEQLRLINRLASKANIVLRSFFERRDLKLVSMTLEFGLDANGSHHADPQMVIGDEISPRTCRFGDLKNSESGQLVEIDTAENGAYLEIHNRIFRTSDQRN